MDDVLERMEERLDIQGLCLASSLKEPFDLIFRVGPERTKFFCHTRTFKQNSRRFDGLGDQASKEGRVSLDIPEVSREAFLVVVRHIYKKVLIVRIEDLADAMHIASKYRLMSLEVDLLKFARKKINWRNAISVLMQFEKYTALLDSEYSLFRLKNVCLEAVDKYGVAALLSPDFASISNEIMCEIARRDSLKIKECTLATCVIFWAKEECARLNLPHTIDSIRGILGPCFFMIRFPLMTTTELYTLLETNLIMREEEYNQILGYIIDQPKSIELPFSTKSRRELGRTVCRFKSQKMSRVKHVCRTHQRMFHQIDVKVSKMVRLVGVGVYVPKSYQIASGSLAMSFELYHTDAQQRILAMGKRMFFATMSDPDIFHFIFMTCIFLHPATRYSMVLNLRYFDVRNKKPEDFAVMKGKSGSFEKICEIGADKVCWKFRNPTRKFGLLSRLHNRSDVFVGQMPEILFDMP